MVEYLVGNYLVESGKITREQLDVVLDKQDSTRVKLGVIAVAEGMMTAEQAETVNSLQVVMDKRFGDIAVEKGYLTDEQVGKLLKKQGNAYLMFVQTLMDEKLLDINGINKVMDEFRKAYGLNNSELEDIKSDDVERIVPSMIPEEAEEYAQLFGIALRTMVRFIDRHIYIKRAQMIDVEKIAPDTIVRQSMEGTQGILDGFYECTGGLLEVCRKFGQEEFEFLDEDALDAGGEMINCINGLYVSAKSRDGSFLELMPPEYDEIGDAAAGRKVCALPIYIKNKALYFIVGKLS